MLFNTIIFQSLYMVAKLQLQVEAACNGVLTVKAVASEIQDMSQHAYGEEVGKVSYVADSAGNLQMNSITPGFTCGPIMNFVSSNTTISRLVKRGGADTHKPVASGKQASSGPVQSVGGQLHCSNTPQKLGVDWVAPWDTIVFYGSLFLQIEIKGDGCGKPAELVLDYSRCSYNATTNTSRKATGIPCNWSA